MVSTPGFNIGKELAGILVIILQSSLDSFWIGNFQISLHYFQRGYKKAGNH